jgi:hypothetical protein
VLTGELPRDGVEVAQPFDGDEEGLLVVEPVRQQVFDLLAQVVFELLHVGGGDRLPALHVAAPPVDLSLEVGVKLHQAHPSATMGDLGEACQT